MSDFRLAFIGSQEDKKKVEIAKRRFESKNTKKSSIILIDVTGLTQDQIEEKGSFQGFIYYDSIHNDPVQGASLKDLISSQLSPTDMVLFPLTHGAVTQEKRMNERVKMGKVYRSSFPKDDLSKVKLSLSNVNDSHELQSYFEGVIAPVSDIYCAKADRVQRTAEEKLKRFVDNVIDAIKGKHSYTAGHVTRVSKYTEMLAKQMGLDEKVVEEITLAAKLHDIGKIAITDKILTKKSSLDTLERKEMGEHAEQGGIILDLAISQDPELEKLITPKVREAVANHHKDWDGMHDRRGEDEPDPIRGDSIGEYALIIAVADCLDSMTSQRAYNNPKHILDTFRDLYSHRGTQFRADIAEAAIVMLGKEFASLGIDPLKIVADEPKGKNEELDKKLQEFLVSKSDEFIVNQEPQPGAYSPLGFRIDNSGYFEFEGKEAVRKPKIRYINEVKFRKLKEFKHKEELKRAPLIDEEKSEITEKIKKEVTQDFKKQDEEGKAVMERARVSRKRDKVSENTAVEEPRETVQNSSEITSVEQSSFSDQITDGSDQILEYTKKNPGVNIENLNKSINEINREVKKEEFQKEEIR